ncbi:phosphoribosyl-AMP cyclohydrolase [Candidatus Vallotia lariciata]|uniref:phosphoribosyl-AMP cyclohydrolase n=1 Tax=Candidatus Vallotia laricis TaxID=2018052 RepID=UPI001D013B80|nr:phosphoribosyl-AMP cyclohydrolase [Candidatus Vallotia lariciata]UDG82768.1 Phosphoribosyl-AMP cyclohydrolase [Candidatus Vallotia lariciata]
MSSKNWLNKVKWDTNGLVPAVVQQSSSNDILMVAWMNREALIKTIELKRAVYFSRSRNKLWFKGEVSGHLQHVREVRLDCDRDVVLLRVEQVSDIACHTGRHSCFFWKFEGFLNKGDWISIDPILKNPESIYL